MPPFDDQSTYSKFQADCDENDCGCSSSSDDCGCCPPGLVSVTDDCGKNIGCLSPNDASLYEITTHIPPTGYIKAFDPVTGAYLGDLTPEAYIDYLAASNPAITPIPTQGVFNPTTVDSVSMTVAPLNDVSNVAVNFSVDRVSCDEAILVTLVSPPAGVTFLSGLLSLVIGAEESVVEEGIEITDAVAVGVYNISVVYSGCSVINTKILTLNVT